MDSGFTEANEQALDQNLHMLTGMAKDVALINAYINMRNALTNPCDSYDTPTRVAMGIKATTDVILAVTFVKLAIAARLEALSKSAAGSDGRLYRTIHKKDPIAKQFQNTGDIGDVRPHGGHSDPNRHSFGDTESVFTSWSKNREKNWTDFGPRPTDKSVDYIQMEIDTGNIPNRIIDQSHIPLDETEVLIESTVRGARRVR